MGRLHPPPPPPGMDPRRWRTPSGRALLMLLFLPALPVDASHSCKDGNPILTCSSGQYCPGTTCKSCPPGRFTSSSNRATSCTPCAAGTYSLSGSLYCTVCPAGTFSAVPGAQSPMFCNPCLPGDVSPAGSTQCGTSCEAAGTQLKGNSSCVCVPGKYQKSSYEAACVNCPGGKFSLADSACNVCSAGTAAPAGSSRCTDCVVGKFSTAQAASCKDCVAGRYGATIALSSCAECGIGKLSPSGAGQCETSCLPGTFTTGLRTCEKCPAGKQQPSRPAWNAPRAGLRWGTAAVRAARIAKQASSLTLRAPASALPAPLAASRPLPCRLLARNAVWGGPQKAKRAGRFAITAFRATLPAPPALATAMRALQESPRFLRGGDRLAMTVHPADTSPRRAAINAWIATRCLILIAFFSSNWVFALMLRDASLCAFFTAVGFPRSGLLCQRLRL